MMTRTSPLLPALFVLATSLAAPKLLAAPEVHYEPLDESHELKVDGTSNVHDWEAETQRISGSLRLPGQWQRDDDRIQLQPQLDSAEAQPRLTVRVPVRSLKSGKNGLDKNMYKALEADDHPHVTFVLKEIEGEDGADGQTVIWQARGDLTIAGATRSVDLELHVTPIENGRLQIKVEKPLKMTEFDIDPPTAMFGMARAKDDVTVTATWIVERRTPQPTIPEVETSTAHRKQMTQVLIAYGRAQQALASDDRSGAQDHLATLIDEVDALAQLDTEALPETWPATLDRLNIAANSVAEAKRGNAMRASFAVLTERLVEAVSKIGFEHSSPIAAYQHPDGRGTAGAAWLHIPLNDDQGKPMPIRSPYGAAGSEQPEQTALYLPRLVTDEEING